MNDYDCWILFAEQLTDSVWKRQFLEMSLSKHVTKREKRIAKNI